jgi:hypothetical protein
MRTIRFGVFETNSSSTHSLTIATKSQFDKWVNNELAYDQYKNKLVECDEDDEELQSYEDFGNEMETFFENYKTECGDEIVVFGYYGYG